MCGIAAILLFPQERSDEDWMVIKEVFTKNLLYNEERGRAATGLAVVQKDGQVNLEKKGITASEFIKTPEYKSLLGKIGSQTTLLLGHTRKPTKGSPEFIDNNHPLQAGSVFGVHNGHIDNDDELFKKFKFHRQGQVDSEIIFRLLEPVSIVELKESYLETVGQKLKLLNGKYTFLACDRRAPEKILVLKHQNPLSIHYHDKWKALIFSSRYIFLRKAFGFSVVTEALPHNQLLMFDAKKLPTLGNQPYLMKPFAEQD